MAYFSSSLSFSTSKVSSHPTSMRTLTPPSSSSNDCEVVDSERAPCRGQKVNMVALDRFYAVMCIFSSNLLLD